MNRRLPLVVILGATGSGKTKLSLELAQKFNGEIIGADSMQVYKGLDIITAKATNGERALVPHHLIDFLEPHEECTVLEYRNSALKIIESLTKRNKMPIIVGGTNYYIESILWKILLGDAGSYTKPGEGLRSNDVEESSEELYRQLQILDPNMAKRLHPHNKRKILRSLEVLQRTGRRHSEILVEQQSSEDGSAYGGGLRYQNSVIFRLQCDKQILDERLNQRVDSMLQQGLVQELTNFHNLYNKNRLAQMRLPDYTTGVFQSIGFKEFHPYLRLAETERSLPEGQQLFKKCVDELKMVTRRYAKKQNKWTTNRFLGRQDRMVPSMYALDTSDINNWENDVRIPAITITESHIHGTPCSYERLPPQYANSAPNAEDDTFFCDICERVFVGQFQWDVHLRSNRHRKMVEKRNRLAKSQRDNPT